MLENFHLSSQAEDPQRHFDLLQEHKLLGHALQDNENDERFQRAWKKNLHRNTLLFSEFKKMSQSLEQDGIDVIALKGTSLLTTIYSKNWGLREMSDIDVLMAPRHREAVRLWLFDRGYLFHPEQKFFANAHKEVWQKSIAGMDIVFELHFDLFAQSKIEHWPTSSSMGIKTLEPHLEFTYLVAHLAHQHNFLKLFWLYDIDLYSKSFELDWSKIQDIARDLKIKRSLDATYYTLRTHLKNSVVPKNQSRIWQHLIDQPQLIQGRNRPFHYFLLKHLLKDSWAQALHYDIAWLYHRFQNKEAKTNKP